MVAELLSNLIGLPHSTPSLNAMTSLLRCRPLISCLLFLASCRVHGSYLATYLPEDYLHRPKPPQPITATFPATGVVLYLVLDDRACLALLPWLGSPACLQMIWFRSLIGGCLRLWTQPAELVGSVQIRERLLQQTPLIKWNREESSLLLPFFFLGLVVFFLSLT